MTVACPECGAAVKLPADALAGELLICESCGVELELVATEPPAVEIFEEEEK